MLFYAFVERTRQFIAAIVDITFEEILNQLTFLFWYFLLEAVGIPQAVLKMGLHGLFAMGIAGTKLGQYLAVLFQTGTSHTKLRWRWDWEEKQGKEEQYFHL